MAYEIEDCGGIAVRYLPSLDGGGRVMGSLYAGAIKTLFGRVGRLHEYCAGPGFIGFHLLAAGLCDTLCLSDVNPAALDALRETVRVNGLEDRVTLVQSDCLDGIPEGERWDLSIANPPHYLVPTEEMYRQNILGHDPQWRIHRRYYAGVARHLTPRGSSLLLENYDGNAESDFLPMLEESGLRFAGSFMFHSGQDCTYLGVNRFYFFWAVRERPELLWQNDHPAETLLLRLPAKSDALPRLELRDRQKVRLDLFNDSPDPLFLGLLEAGGRFIYPFPFPLQVTPGAKRTTGIFYLTEGDYSVVHIAPHFHHRDILWRGHRPFESRILAELRVRRTG